MKAIENHIYMSYVQKICSPSCKVKFRNFFYNEKVVKLFVEQVSFEEMARFMSDTSYTHNMQCPQFTAKSVKEIKVKKQPSNCSSCQMCQMAYMKKLITFSK